MTAIDVVVVDVHRPVGGHAINEHDGEQRLTRVALDVDGVARVARVVPAPTVLRTPLDTLAALLHRDLARLEKVDVETVGDTVAVTARSGSPTPCSRRRPTGPRWCAWRCHGSGDRGDPKILSTVS